MERGRKLMSWERYVPRPGVSLPYPDSWIVIDRVTGRLVREHLENEQAHYMATQMNINELVKLEAQPRRRGRRKRFS
jgi:hypothetical protein